MKAAQVFQRIKYIPAYQGAVDTSCGHGYEDRHDCPLCGVFDSEHVDTIDAYCAERGLAASPSKKAQVLRAILGAQR